jgi:hypothetical protein
MKTLCWPSLPAVVLASFVLPVSAGAIEIKVSAQALERMLNTTL